MTEQVQDLRVLYHRRFSQTAAYRNRVWQELTDSFFSSWVRPDATVLDLGCGYGEFINNVRAGRKLAMDLNPDAPKHLAESVEFLEQDCAADWPLPDQMLDVVFSSNFFEHLPDKICLQHTLQQAFRCLKPGGRLISVGPNIRYLAGAYWDFFDHHIPLSEASLGEAIEIQGFAIEKSVPRFLPYTLVNAPEYPIFLLKLYLLLPCIWWLKGRQFLVVAVRPTA
ncbi:MAG: class I SAM-dependent methyltransferase [Planctomycetota bacterium]|nr:class I SAM-dependent methyltransferase [Planctomycetota bacterium]